MPEQNTNDEVVSTSVNPSDLVGRIIEGINKSKYILVALSSDPSIDELSAAIGLTLYLDRIGKRATAIYSGGLPEALGFLTPSETFDKTADVMQDFVIALDKNKADHLRYKTEGDSVKIFITPFSNKIADTDLNFSYGDFNVDYVLALNVSSGIELDPALREYGRIMRDATIVNITTGRAGKLGEIEWSEPTASSVSELVANLLHELSNDGVELDKNESTALFAGIVSATNSFSNASTTPFTLTVGSWLMECGANPQLVSENITSSTESRVFNDLRPAAVEEPVNDSVLESIPAEEGNEEGTSDSMAELQEVQEALSDNAVPIPEMDDADEPVSQEPVVQEAEPAIASREPVDILSSAEAIEAAPVAEPVVATPVAEPVAAPASVAEPIVAPSDELIDDPTIIQEAPEPENESFISKETVIDVPETFNPETMEDVDSTKFGKMLEDALAEDDTVNPAMMSAPSVAMQPEVNGVPDINYAPTASADILPPPPAPADFTGMPMPPVDGADLIQSRPPVQLVTPEPVAPVAPQPVAAVPTEPVAMPTPAPVAPTAPAATDPSSFIIPGM